MEDLYDLAIIGGGINGCGVAAAAALQGLSVLLVEKGDLASKTSSSSTKLIHGGLRYLEQYHFSLVRKALKERQILLELAPHLVKPLAMVLPYQAQFRPYWFIRLGLFIYDHLNSSNTLPRCAAISRKNHANYFLPLNSKVKKGFLFYDCKTDDARLSLSAALQARDNGADILLHTEFTKAERTKDLWCLEFKNSSSIIKNCKAKLVINAAGPWAEEVDRRLGLSNGSKLELVKGSHIVTKKLYEGEHAYFLQHSDKRFIFIIPYFDFTLIGTTEKLYKDSLSAIKISSDEINYLRKFTNSALNTKFSEKDIITTWSGLRPLLATSSKNLRTLNRDYSFKFIQAPNPSLSIYGGKLTTFRQLSREIINTIATIFPQLQKKPLKQPPLPGAVFGSYSFKDYAKLAKTKYSWLPDTLFSRLLATYGTRMEFILKDCSSHSDLGKSFGSELYQSEVDYLIKEEWASSSEDILWRRTKLGLYFDATAIKALDDYLISKLKA